MKQLLYLVLSLVVIAAIIPQASAAYNCSMVPSVDSYSGDQPWTINSGVTTQAQAIAKCTACGISANGANVYMVGYNSGDSWIWDSRIAGLWQSRNLTDSSIRYVKRWIQCTSGGVETGLPVRVSDGACLPATEYLFINSFDILYHTPLVPTECTAGTRPNKTVNFTATPLFGNPSLTVAFTDTSLNVFTPAEYNWSITPTTGVSGFFGNTISHSAVFSQSGNYTVSHGASDAYGSGILSRSDYIWVYNSTATKTKYFQTIDGTSGNIVTNSTINLKDVENSSWVNGTFPADGMSSITTLVGHHINAYASLTGFSDAEDLNLLNDGEPRYIMMWPTFAKNVSAGNVSLYVTVQDKDTHAAIKGAQVTMSPSTGSAQGTTTNEAGIAYFVVKNQTLCYITAQATGQGYSTGVTTINTGSGSGGSASAAATILLSKNLVTQTPTTVVTTLPGGGTPTPTVTVLPGCEDQVTAEGQAKCRAAQSNQGLSYLSAHMMDLIMICVFVTIMYLLGIRLGK
jgi:PKD repeat protein